MHLIEGTRYVIQHQIKVNDEGDTLWVDVQPLTEDEVAYSRSYTKVANQIKAWKTAEAETEGTGTSPTQYRIVQRTWSEIVVPERVVSATVDYFAEPGDQLSDDDDDDDDDDVTSIGEEPTDVIQTVEHNAEGTCCFEHRKAYLDENL